MRGRGKSSSFHQEDLSYYPTLVIGGQKYKNKEKGEEIFPQGDHCVMGSGDRDMQL
jgi:hypothetical protein